MVRMLLRQSVTFIVLDPWRLCFVLGMLFKLPMSEVILSEHSFSIRESLWWSIYILPDLGKVYLRIFPLFIIFFACQLDDWLFRWISFYWAFRWGWVPLQGDFITDLSRGTIVYCSWKDLRSSWAEFPSQINSISVKIAKIIPFPLKTQIETNYLTNYPMYKTV